MSVSIATSTVRTISTWWNTKLCGRRTVDPVKLAYNRYTVVWITSITTNEIEFDWIEQNVMMTNRLIERMIEWMKTNRITNETNKSNTNWVWTTLTTRPFILLFPFAALRINSAWAWGPKLVAQSFGCGANSNLNLLCRSRCSCKYGRRVSSSWWWKKHAPSKSSN